MQKPIPLACLIVLAAACAGHAQSTVNFSSEPGMADVWFGSGVLANNNVVEVGYFDKGFDVVANAGNLLSLTTAWREYASTTIKAVGAQPGRFAGSASSTDTQFDGQSIYMWIFSTVNNTAPADDYSNVNGYGLFTSANGSWKFPLVGSLAGGTTYVYSSQVDQALFGSFNANHLYLAHVPEPSLVALLVLALGSLLLFRHPSQEKKH